MEIGGIHNLLLMNRTTLAITHQVLKETTGFPQTQQTDGSADLENSAVLDDKEAVRPHEYTVTTLVPDRRQDGVA